MGKSYLSAVIFLIISAIFIGLGVKQYATYTAEPIEMEDVEWDTLEAGDRVSITVDLIWDCIYSETTTNTVYFVEVSSHESGRGYAIPHLFVDRDGYYDIDFFIGLRLNGKDDFETAQQIMDETNDWYFDTTGRVDYGMTTMEIDGVLKKMTSEEYDLMKEYLTYYCGYSSSEADDIIVPLMIQKVSPAAHMTLFIVGGVLLLFGIFAFVSIKAKKKQAEEMLFRPASTVSAPTNAYGENPYYSPDNSIPAPGAYQYGGTNAYGNSDIYAGNSYTPPQQVNDSETGLSMDFLKRSEEERLQREREAQYKAPEPSQNPLYGSQAPQAPVTPSQSFSNYESTLQNNGTLGGGIYGTRNDNQ
ncbi:MAG: hypothetical protein IJZ00_03010 [Lachnospiraceae bacterium]|nr:hypothetical protein [Lachnospiraceae bacterium]